MPEVLKEVKKQSDKKIKPNYEQAKSLADA